MSAATPVLPGSLKGNPRLGAWLDVAREGHVTIFPGKVELGQGILTALVQIAAEELDVDPARVKLAPASTAHSPNEGVTSGSLSIQDCGSALRHVCAQARAIYLDAAAQRLGVPADRLAVEDGAIRGPDNLATSYWELADPALLECDARPGIVPKSVEAHRISGKAFSRVDLPEKIFGLPRFAHDRMQGGSLHGRVLRPPSPAATIAHFDDTRARAVAGVIAVVRDGRFIGLIAASEAAAVAALEKLRADVRWNEPATLPDEFALADWLKATPAETTTVIERPAETTTVPARTVKRAFLRPFTAHASIGPSLAAAQWQDEVLHVWTHSQGIYNLRADLALVFRMPADRIVVGHMEGSGCYGHNGADDVALDAALLARARPGERVRVQWMREDELAWSPFGPAMLVEVEADLDTQGEVTGWRHDIRSNGHASRPGRGSNPTLLAASHIADGFPMLPAANMPMTTGGGSDRNSIPEYAFPSLAVRNHRLLDMPIRTSAMRALGAVTNVFAIESMADEIARLRDEDPLAWRLRHLENVRSRAVIERVARESGWHSRKKKEGRGRGLAFARYKHTGAWCAVVADIEAEESVRVTRLCIAVDAGEVINPDGVVNQIEGGAIQATSWALKEAVRFDATRITSTTWETYPILTFTQVPAVDVHVIDRPAEKSLGAGEAAQGPTVAAIANAIYDALGVRITRMPFTTDSIVAAME